MSRPRGYRGDVSGWQVAQCGPGLRIAYAARTHIDKKIGLPSLLPTFDGLLHSTFLDSVTSGQKNPLFEYAAFAQNCNGIGNQVFCN
jgi:hypothetical protein